MIFEATIKYKLLTEKGEEKEVKESFIIENAELFAEVEQMLYSLNYDDMKVTAIKPSKIMEVANARQQTSDLIFIAEVQDTFLQDDGSEKYTKYKMVFFAPSIESAYSFIREYVKQGYDMKVVSLKESNFIDVL